MSILIYRKKNFVIMGTIYKLLSLVSSYPLCGLRTQKRPFFGFKLLKCYDYKVKSIYPYCFSTSQQLPLPQRKKEVNKPPFKFNLKLEIDKMS
jgi:hypothetical protein